VVPSSNTNSPAALAGTQAMPSPNDHVSAGSPPDPTPITIDPTPARPAKPPITARRNVLRTIALASRGRADVDIGSQDHQPARPPKRALRI
jgi:hypothetical protein